MPDPSRLCTDCESEVVWVDLPATIEVPGGDRIRE